MRLIKLFCIVILVAANPLMATDKSIARDKDEVIVYADSALKGVDPFYLDNMTTRSTAFLKRVGLDMSLTLLPRKRVFEHKNLDKNGLVLSVRRMPALEKNIT